MKETYDKVKKINETVKIRNDLTKKSNKGIMKKSIMRYVLIGLIIINCSVIFSFSSEKSEKSNNTSGKVVDVIVKLYPKTRNLEGKTKIDAKERIVMPIRKTAHFSIYMCLGFLIFSFTNTFNKINNYKKRILISEFCTFIYACSDELHQYFVPGRSCEFRDVCIDSFGALVGILLSFIIIKLKNKKKFKIKNF